MIRVVNLTKRFGRTTAVDNLSFEVNRGEVVGFLGPNGAGKTTTMRIISGFLQATGGTVTVAGIDVFRESYEVRRRIGYLPENVPIYTDMRVSEYLRYRGRLKGLRGRKLRSRVHDVMEACDLTAARRSIIGRLSKGFRRRVGLADSLVHEPDVLILDEPTIGLDPSQVRNFRCLIKEFARHHTILLSSHILQVVETLCERVLIIDKGRLVASDRPENLIGLMKGSARVVIEIRGEREAVLAEIPRVPGVASMTCETSGDWHRVTCACVPGTDAREALFRAVAGKGWTLREMSIEKGNLEDVFIALTGVNSNGKAAGAAAAAVSGGAAEPATPADGGEA